MRSVAERASPGASGAPGVTVTEVRVLEGPNLYFSRPAVKVSLRVPGYLALEKRAASDLARRLGLGSSRPGAPGTAQRQRFVLRLAAHVVRRVASGVGVNRLGVRTRTGSTVEDIVVALPWRHRGWGQATGEQVGPVLELLLTAGAEQVGGTIAAAAERVRSVEPGPDSTVIAPRVPVVSITGTNGKTTTTRIVVHIAMTAGLRTAWSSTSGVVVMGETIEEGDFSGPAGARAVLATPGLEVGVLETARGGMLLKGMGISTNDVSVVTNVTADQLGLQGIDTLDQLAEVKVIVTTITKPGGWVVLNGDDPRVWPMRHRVRAQPWAFSLDPDAPALRESLSAGGRGITVLDGDIVVLTPGADPDRLAKVVDVPVTLSGLARHNIANALAGAAAALGLGMPRAAVVEGLRTFRPDPVLNEGRLNTYSVPAAEGGSATVILDMAHNEAGLEALLEVAHGLTAQGGRVHLGLGATGDRPDEAIQGLGELAGKGADHVVLAHKRKYLRGRTIEDIEAHLRAGLGRVGVVETESFDSETEGITAMMRSVGDGDVVALMCHEQRAEIAEWLHGLGATADDSRTVRRKVVAARGEHEAEGEIAALWATPDEGERIAMAERLRNAHPDDPRLVFELASALDAVGREVEAVSLYHLALEGGLREPHRHRAQIQAASSHRNLGRPDAALHLLDEVDAFYPGSASVAALRALALFDSGQVHEALANLVDALLDHAADEDSTAYRRALHGYADEVRARSGS